MRRRIHISTFMMISSLLRKLAMLLHPDKTEVVGAQEVFKLLGAARNSIMKTYRD